MLFQAFSRLFSFLHHYVLNINNLDYNSFDFSFLHPFFQPFLQILLLLSHGDMTVTCGLLEGLLVGYLRGYLWGYLWGHLLHQPLL